MFITSALRCCSLLTSTRAASKASRRIFVLATSTTLSHNFHRKSSNGAGGGDDKNPKDANKPASVVVVDNDDQHAKPKQSKLFRMSEFDVGASQPIPSPDDPLGRALRILKRDFVNMSKGQFSAPESDFFPTYVDVAIIGGGIVGSSIAFWLKHQAAQGLKVLVIDKDLSFTRSSTALAVGGLQQQFSLRENIQMAMFGAEFMRNTKKYLTVLDMDPPDIHFTPYGHLFLANESEVETLKDSFELQKELGAQVDLLTSTKVKERFPWINVDDVELACCGYCSEGWFDPILLHHAFKQKATSLGARYLNATVTGFSFTPVQGIKIVDDGERQYEKISQIVVRTEDGFERLINPSYIVLAAGSDSREIGKLARIGTFPGVLKYEIPVERRKRYSYAVECAEGPGIDCPHVVDHNGAYFRREGFGGNYVCGKTPNASEEPDPAHLDVDYSYFENRLLPLLRRRVPNFQSLKLTSAWASIINYNTFDRAGFVGWHPYYGNFMMATGFEGLSAQQSPAIGRAISELIVDGEYTTLDLRRLEFDRIANEEPIYERNIV